VLAVTSVTDVIVIFFS